MGGVAKLSCNTYRRDTGFVVLSKKMDASVCIASIMSYE